MPFSRKRKSLDYYIFSRNRKLFHEILSFWGSRCKPGATNLQIGNSRFGQGKEYMKSKIENKLGRNPGFPHPSPRSAGKGLGTDCICSPGKGGGKGLQVKAGHCAEEMLQAGVERDLHPFRQSFPPVLQMDNPGAPVIHVQLCGEEALPAQGFHHPADGRNRQVQLSPL